MDSERLIELELENQLLRELKVVFPKQEQPYVSIVIPCYNQFVYTRRCLFSIAMHSDGLNYEVILADDHSTDETPQAEQQFSNLRIITNESGTKGFLPNVNYASQFARGRYLLILNNDTMLPHDWYRPLMEEFEQHDDIGVIGGMIRNPFTNTLELGRIILPTGESRYISEIVMRHEQAKHPIFADVDFVQGAFFLMRKEVWNNAGGFDPVYSPGYFEETDLCMRLKLQYGLRVVCLHGMRNHPFWRQDIFTGGAERRVSEKSQDFRGALWSLLAQEDRGFSRKVS